MKSLEEGGAEALYEGLLKNLKETSHEVEEVEVVIDETTFDSILESYLKCYDLDLGDYDLIISTKAPTHMVRHRNHVSYLFHTIRVFYDRFESEFEPSEERLSQRNLIHSLDKFGLHPDRVKKHLSIGFTPYQRLRHADPFWADIDFEVLHPPTPLSGFKRPRAAEHVFLPGRLHRWKRVDLLIRAFKHVKADIPLMIAGTGEDEPSLRALAADDPRVQFLGRVSTEQLFDLYAGAVVVPFLPIDEDYGYITIEAFLSRKPVITCTDSGEPTFFVKDFETGFIVEPKPEAIADKIDYLVNHPKLAADMGERGYLRASQISWNSVLHGILTPANSSNGESVHQAGEFPEKEANTRAPNLEPVSLGREPPVRSATTTGNEDIHKVSVLDMQPIDPPVGGGRIRVLGLYHGLGKSLPTTYLGSFDWRGESYRRHNLSETLEEIDIPLSDAHFKVNDKWTSFTEARTVIDVAFPLMAHLSPEFVEKARALAKESDVVVFSHPWIYPLVRDSLDHSRQLVVYDAQNFEGLLRTELLDDGGFGSEIAKHVVATEHELARLSDVILVCSKEDGELFSQVYGVEAGILRETPNGVFSRALYQPTPAEKDSARRALNIIGKSAIFIGSDFRPNIEAVEFICLQLAGSIPELTFIICGGVGDVSETAQLRESAPSNVKFLGSVTEAEKVRWLWAADLAINPMFSGSGTNIKMFDFMAVGLPTVSTAVGARGIELGTPPAALVSDIREFQNAVRSVMDDEALASQLGKRGRLLIERKYSWENISPGLASAFVQALNQKRRARANLSPTRDRSDTIKTISSFTHSKDRESGALSNITNLAFLTTWQTRCGIAEYTSCLINALTLRNVNCWVLAISESSSVACAPANSTSLSAAVLDMNRYEERGAEGDLVDKCRTMGIEWVSFQYHPIFYSEDTLVRLVNACVRSGLRVSVTLHNTQIMSVECLSELGAIGATLLVHSIEEQQRLASLITAKISRLPFGVLEVTDEPSGDARRRLGISDSPVIGTFGFLREHKGLLEIIEATAFLRDLFPNIFLLGMNALYPSPDSEEYLKECARQIDRMGINRHVQIETKFLEIDQVIRNLHACDVIVLPYKFSSEGASAAAHTVIASRRPLIVTRQEIFRDVSTAAYQVERSEPAALAASIAALLSSPPLISRLKRKSEEYIHTNRWDAVATKYLAALSGSTGAAQPRGQSSYFTMRK
jgi:glycosyltransferase involved in cell wall biosynthesis